MGSVTGRHRADQPSHTGRLAAWTAAGWMLAAMTFGNHQNITPEAVAAHATAPTPNESPTRPSFDIRVAAHKAVPTRVLKVVGRQGLTANAAALLSYIDITYPEVTVVGGVRPDPIPDHPTGHALDIMVGSNQALGQRICDDMLAQFDRFHIRYLIYRETYRRPGVARWMVNRGSPTANHFDHVHLTVNG